MSLSTSTFYSNYNVSGGTSTKILCSNIPCSDVVIPTFSLSYWTQSQNPSYDYFFCICLVKHGSTPDVTTTPNITTYSTGITTTTSQWVSSSGHTLVLHCSSVSWNMPNAVAFNGTIPVDYSTFARWVDTNTVTSFDIYFSQYADGSSANKNLILGTITVYNNVINSVSSVNPLNVTISSGGLLPNNALVNSSGELLVSSSGGGGGGDVNIATINGIIPTMVNNKLVVIPTSN